MVTFLKKKKLKKKKKITKLLSKNFNMYIRLKLKPLKLLLHEII